MNKLSPFTPDARYPYILTKIADLVYVARDLHILTTLRLRSTTILLDHGHFSLTLHVSVCNGKRMLLEVASLSTNTNNLLTRCV